MTHTTDAIYENAVLRTPGARWVRVAVDDCQDDERAEWLDQSERRLTTIWDNSAIDVFNDLLTP